MFYTVRDILHARNFLKGKVRHTPLEYSPALSRRTGGRVWLKMENLQLTGSYKLRGVYNKIHSMSEEEKSKGIVTSSSGNHAQAVAMIAREMGIKAVVFVPGQCPEVKRASILMRGEGNAELCVVGNFYDDAARASVAYAEETGMTYVSPSSDRAISIGHGTAGMEIVEDLPDVDALLSPLASGGLVRGLTVAVRSFCGDALVFGVHPENNPCWGVSWTRGEIVPVAERPSIADALSGTGCPEHFAYLKDELTGMVGVSETEIEDAIRFMLFEHRVVVEGSGAVTVAAVLSGKVDLKGRNAALFISGGNIGRDRLRALFPAAGGCPEDKLRAV